MRIVHHGVNDAMSPLRRDMPPLALMMPLAAPYAFIIFSQRYALLRHAARCFYAALIFAFAMLTPVRVLCRR